MPLLFPKIAFPKFVPNIKSTALQKIQSVKVPKRLNHIENIPKIFEAFNADVKNNISNLKNYMKPSYTGNVFGLPNFRMNKSPEGVHILGLAAQYGTIENFKDVIRAIAKNNEKYPDIHPHQEDMCKAILEPNTPDGLQKLSYLLYMDTYHLSHLALMPSRETFLTWVIQAKNIRALDYITFVFSPLRINVEEHDFFVTALLEAIKTNYVPGIRFLIEKGISPNLVINDASLLHIATRNNVFEAVVALTSLDAKFETGAYKYALQHHDTTDPRILSHFEKIADFKTDLNIQWKRDVNAEIRQLRKGNLSADHQPVAVNKGASYTPVFAKKTGEDPSRIPDFSNSLTPEEVALVREARFSNII